MLSKVVHAVLLFLACSSVVAFVLGLYAQAARVHGSGTAFVGVAVLVGLFSAIVIAEGKSRG